MDIFQHWARFFKNRKWVSCMEFQMIRLERIIERREINSRGCLKWLFLKVQTSEHEWTRVTTSDKSDHEWPRMTTSVRERPRVTTSENSLKYIFSVIMRSLIRHFIKLRLLNRKELISGDNKNRTWNISFPFPKGRARTKWNPGVIL